VEKSKEKIRWDSKPMVKKRRDTGGLRYDIFLETESRKGTSDLTRLIPK